MYQNIQIVSKNGNLSKSKTQRCQNVLNKKEKKLTKLEHGELDENAKQLRNRNDIYKEFQLSELCSHNQRVKSTIES